MTHRAAESRSMRGGLHSYLPIDRRLALAAGAELPTEVSGSVLEADLAGFTVLTDALTRELGEQRGAEELSRRLNVLFDALVGEVHRFGGTVLGFSGDAFTSWLDGDDGLRAAACAQALQAWIGENASALGGNASALELKVAVATGQTRRFLPPGGYTLAVHFDGALPLYQTASATAPFSATFIDAAPPTLTLPGDITATASSTLGALVRFTAPATDTVDPRPVVACTPASGSLFPVGTTVVSCSAADTAGNHSAPRTFQVVVQAGSTPKSLLQGALATVTTLVGSTAKPDRDKLEDARKKLQDAVAGPWTSDTTLDPQKGDAVFNNVKDAANKLRELATDRKSTVPAATLGAVIGKLTDAANALARAAIDAATQRGGDARKLAEARSELAKAADALGKGNPSDAIDHDRQAWAKAQEALKP